MFTRRTVLLGTAVLAASARAAGEQAIEWRAGTHYKEVSPPQPTRSDSVEVVEFFWYGCPQCYTLEPHLVLWNQTRPDQVRFVTTPVAWRAQRVEHARLFHTLRTLRREDLHGEVFDSIHRRRLKLSTLAEQIDFARARGIDPREFELTHRAAVVDQALAAADKTSRAFRIAGVPTIAVNGKYVLQVAPVGSERQLVSLLRHLVAQELALLR